MFLLLASIAGVSAQDARRDFVLPESGVVLPAPLKRSVESIRATSLAAHIGFLASPALEGRGLGSRGLDAAAEYIATQLALMNIRTFGDRPGSYFQQVPLREISLAAGKIQVGESRTFQAGVDWLLPELEPQQLSAPVVFAGHGIRDETLHYDDLKGLDLKDKFVVIRDGLPPGSQWRTPEFFAKYGAEDPEDRYASRLELFSKLGAKAMLVIEEDLAKQLARQKPDGAPYYLSPEKSGEQDEIPLFRISAATGEALLAGATEARIEITGREHATSSRNVIGCIPGFDPKLPAVILGAHMDHLGLQGGVIHPGADDNASGVSALLEIARTFAARPHPCKRTLIFAFWTGEEEAKFGSTHYVHHPLWPMARTAVYINLDMIGHPWSREEIRKLLIDAHDEKPDVFLSKIRAEDFVEPGFPPSMPRLEEVLRKAGQSNGLAMHLDRTDGRSGGSDYRAFARAGLPFIRFFGNYFPGYHKPEDTPESLDSRQVQKLARMAFATAWMLAEQ